MTKAKKLRVLSELYATIPDVGCKGLCFAACATIPATSLEYERMVAASMRPLPAADGEGPLAGVKLVGVELGGSCPALVAKRCTVYEARPVICRLYGVGGMRCPHGCAPTTPMTENEERELVRRVAAL